MAKPEQEPVEAAAQLDFDFRPGARATVRFSPDLGDDSRRLMIALKGRGWVLRAQLEDRLGWTDRRIRKAASDSAGHVISGNAGYRLTREASPEEIRHARARLRSQAREELRRFIQIGRVAHQSLN